MTLLRRHGILTREVLAAQPGASWSELLFALRRLEYSPEPIRRGYFVRSLGGEQYALPEAVEMLRAIRTAPPARPTMAALMRRGSGESVWRRVAWMRYRA